jgi:GDPmannose 4,6-dehydratase
LGIQDVLILGNLDAKRDWGYAPDYVEGMWKIIQHDSPEDFVLATGETHSVREFVELAFGYFKEKIHWKGKGTDEIGVLSSSGKTVVKIDRRYFRPTEVDLLQGDYTKAKTLLSWEPKILFKELINIMVESDYNKIKDN